MPIRRAMLLLWMFCAAAIARAQATQPARATPPPAQATSQPAQSSASQDPQTDQPYTLQTGASLILVPTTVDIKGKVLYGLTKDQFTLTDDGQPRPFRLEESTEGIGLSLVVLLQCSRSAIVEYSRFQGLPTMIDSLIGAAPHEVALVRYGAHPELIQPFTRKQDKIEAAMPRMAPCEDNAAATTDALSYAASILENRDPRYRRAIMLISETRDHGSHVPEAQVIAQLGRNNIVVDSFAYSPYRDDLRDEVKPGRGPGLFGTALQLLMATVQAFRQNVPKTVSRLSGGEYDNFGTEKGFDNAALRLANRIHNYYLLSFTVPGGATPGLHELEVKIPQYPEATIRARRNYWVGAPPDASTAPAPAAPAGSDSNTQAKPQ
ncbi:VWA domain-containing protein [Terriglobus aquaticus]|uniref:VWA domain-containing protein n=1 Tax=Terriglobus aquaticus TaxID=940139 RepID=A0ABW9KN09_9BACT|nr:VWA domain-containing protein [Terriglobus aquaticus]